MLPLLLLPPPLPPWLSLPLPLQLPLPLLLMLLLLLPLLLLMPPSSSSFLLFALHLLLPRHPPLLSLINELGIRRRFCIEPAKAGPIAHCLVRVARMGHPRAKSEQLR